LHLPHFAAFPPDLPKICIQAGTSEKGCCPKCGAPYQRILERKRMVIRRSGRRDVMGEQGRTQPSGTMEAPAENMSIGWQPTCSCDAGPPAPCTVLDIFSGTGTTVMVALRLGRNGIGIELSEKYVAMSRERIIGDCPLLNGEGERKIP
jgi:hypothetical protein